MKFLFRWAIRILPVLTIMKGVMSGGDRLGPFTDTVKVALTQYEIMEITKKVFQEYQTGNELQPGQFPEYVKTNYHNQYSLLARKIIAEDHQDFTVDVWGEPFRFIVNEEYGNYKVVSAGIDGELRSKDDIAMDFTIQRQKPIARVVKKTIIVEAPPEEIEAAEAPAADEDSGQERTIASETPAESGNEGQENFDADGFDPEGYDRDGYDRNGMHRSEKELAAEQTY